MDIRVKTFVAEAGIRLGAAVEELGFVGPEVAREEGYPLAMGVRYHRADVTVETWLILAYGGEEYVQTVVRRGGDESGGDRWVEVGSNTARTGYQMKRALDRHARALADVLRDNDEDPRPEN